MTNKTIQIGSVIISDLGNTVLIHSKQPLEVSVESEDSQQLKKLGVTASSDFDDKLEGDFDCLCNIRKSHVTSVMKECIELADESGEQELSYTVIITYGSDNFTIHCTNQNDMNHTFSLLNVIVFGDENFAA